jgi:Family of unknown function (DUF6893)
MAWLWVLIGVIVLVLLLTVLLQLPEIRRYMKIRAM